MGRVEPTTGMAPFTALVNQVMTTEPCASARRVFWVADNGSSHAGRASIRRMEQAWPAVTLVHLPVHASWLNQVEVVFSVIQRKVIKPADFGARPASLHQDQPRPAPAPARPRPVAAADHHRGQIPRPVLMNVTTSFAPPARCASKYHHS